MSDPVYSFLPWVRSGIANNIATADKDPNAHLRAALTIDLAVAGNKLDGTTDAQTVSREIHLLGPGDVLGIDRRAVIKVEPRDWTTNFEPNYLPYIEFYDEDFPWRYTPAAADTATHRLRPWLTLLVLEEIVEFADGKDRNNKPLPYITLTPEADRAKIFADPNDLWAWAHVHANVDLAPNNEPIVQALANLTAALAQNPDLAYSRLMCPRNLAPNTSYHAFVIPTFESGRLAGLGLEVPDDIVATASSWTNNQKDFPYYYRWFFKTGDFGDFEYLVRMLQPKPVDSRVGVRDIDVLHPGSGLTPIAAPAALGGILKLGGALRVPFATMPPADQAAFTFYDRWDQPFPHPFETKAAALINLADDYAHAPADEVNDHGSPDPVVTLPLYGRWPALTDRLLAAPDNTPLPNRTNWIHRLNLDPRWRAAAGLGTRVVQHDDQKYMEAAWRQVGDVLAANSRIRFAQLAQALAAALHRTHFATLAVEQQFLLTAPVHARIMGSPTTIAAQLRASVVPPAVTSGVFRRITRQGTSLASRLGLAPSSAAAIVRGINAGELVPAPPKVTPPGVITLDDANTVLHPQASPDWLRDLFTRCPWLRFMPAAVLLLVVAIAGMLLGWLIALLALLAGLPLVGGLIRRLTGWTADVPAVRDETATPASVDTIRKVTDFAVAKPGGPVSTPREAAVDAPEAVRFKQALQDVYTFTELKFQTPPRPRLDLPVLAGKAIAGIHPTITIPRKLQTILKIPDWIRIQMIPSETFTPCMAYPVFDAPMYKPLAGLSAELFLPNINMIPNNSLTLLEANPRFIEAYMVGLNHEMARELLWNEFPTDQRGSYFRQFWEVSTLLPTNPTEAQKEALRDIKPLHKWSLTSELGTHNNRGGKTPLALVVRGELLKRYPTAVIYAHKARWQTTNGQADPRKDRLLVDLTAAEEAAPPESKVKMPLFEAKVDPDVYFIGFDLTAEEARGGNTGAEDAGWFFVIKERPGEPRFGLDDTEPGPNKPRVVNWNDLAWSDVGTATGAPIALDTTINLVAYDATLDGENRATTDDAQAQWNPNTDAAELAYMLYRVPVLCAVHAARMLPPEVP